MLGCQPFSEGITYSVWVIITSMRWVPVVGFETSYEVSDTGLVRSIDRVIEIVSRTGKPYKQLRPGKVLSPGRNSSSGHLHVILEGRNDKTIHSLVLEAFVGPRPDGLMARHLDDDPTNNHLHNLTWGTRSENSNDAVKNGRHWQVNKTHCKNGHALEGDNLRTDKRGFRHCRECGRIRGRKYLQRKRDAA